MELLLELFFTAVTALLFSFLIAKLVSAATSADSAHVTTAPSKGVVVDDRGEYVVVEEELKSLGERLEAGSSRSEKREEELVEEVAETVEKFVGEAEAVEEVLESDDSSEEGVSKIEFSKLPRKLVEGVEVGGEKPEGILGNKEEGIIGSEEPEEIGPQLAGEEEAIRESEEAAGRKGESDREEGKKVKSPEEIGEDKDDGDDDWEGIEKSELEKAFAKATKFVVESGERGEGLLGSLGIDVQMELYGLHKVATEGPCRQPPPMPLLLSARAKWNAWQRLGNLSPDVAMEQYIALVSDRVPGWMEDKPTGGGELGSSDSPNSAAVDPDLTISSSDQSDTADERNLEQKPIGEINDLTADSSLEIRVQEK